MYGLRVPLKARPLRAFSLSKQKRDQLLSRPRSLDDLQLIPPHGICDDLIEVLTLPSGGILWALTRPEVNHHIVPLAVPRCQGIRHLERHLPSKQPGIAPALLVELVHTLAADFQLDGCSSWTGEPPHFVQSHKLRLSD